MSVTQRGIKPKDMSEKGQFSLDYSRYQLVDSGDFVMNHMDLLTGWVDISNMNGVTSPTTVCFNRLIQKNIIRIITDMYFKLAINKESSTALGKGFQAWGDGDSQQKYS